MHYRIQGDDLMKKLIIAALFFSMLFLQASIASEMPPNNAKPLSEIVRTLEEKGYSPIVDIEFEDSQWEVKTYKEGVKRKIKIDPVSGKIVSDRKDD
jgi:uncharacterized membrane protein YkoI